LSGRCSSIRWLHRLRGGVTATLTDSFVDTAPADGRADPGSIVTYNATITNSSGTDATGVNFTDTISPFTTLIGGSIKVSPLAFADNYNATVSTPLNIVAPGVLSNDTGTPAPTAVAIAAGPTTAGGTVTLNSDGSFTYNPPASPGPDTFTYTITNGQSPNDTATVSITVGAANTAPVANDDSVAATEAGGAANGTAGTNPAGNVVTGTGSAGAAADTDAQDASSALTVVAVKTGPEATPVTTGTVGTPLAGSYGSLTLNSNGSYTYTVDQNNATVQALRTPAQTLQDVFNYTVQDTGSLQDTATFTITIAGANDNPTAVSDVATAVEASGANNGTAGTDPGGDVLANDTDVDTVANGETKTVQGVAVGNQAGPLSTNVGVGLTGAGALNYGTLTIAANGVYTYVVNQSNAAVQALNTGGTLTDTFSYTMKDAANVTSTTTITITIQGADDNPTAVADSPTAVLEDAVAAAVTVLTNDTDPDGGTKSITGVTQPANGAVVITGGGTGLTYQPNANYCNHSPGSSFDTFDYTLNGGSTATVSMNVTCVNDPPINTVPGPQFVADNGTLTFSSGNSNQISTSDVDAGASNVQVTVSVPATKGTLSGTGFTGNGTNSITITNTLANVNTALNTVVYTPPAGTTQAVTLTVLTSDLGNTGTGGTQTDSDTVTINIDQAPFVSSTVPADLATQVGTQANITVTFSEAVNVTGTWFTVSCASSGAHTAAVSGGPTTWILNPDTDFSTGEICTVTILAAQVTDTDTNDPPDNMAVNKVFSFTTDVPPTVVPPTTPANSSLSNLKTTTITIPFSEAIDATANAVTLNCGASNLAFTGLPQTNVNSLVLTPSASLPPGSTCTVTVVATDVTDHDAGDPPNQLDGNGDGTEGDNYVFTFGVRPDAVNDAYNSTGNVGIVIAANGVLSNDVGTGAVVDRVGNASANVVVPGGGSASSATSAGGSVTLSSDGSFIYNPLPGQASGTDTFKYRITNAGGSSVDATVTITITGIVWFVCDACGGSNAGTLQNPYTSINSFSTNNTGAANKPNINQRIFIRTGTYDASNDNLTLLNGQLVSGQGQAATSFFTPEPNSPAAYAALTASTRPLIAPTAGNAVTLASGNSIFHFDIGNASSPNSGTLLTGASVGNLTASNMIVSGNGRAINFAAGGTLNVVLDSVSSTNSTTDGITVGAFAGTLTMNGGTLTNATGIDFSSSGDNDANITYAGGITDDVGSLITIAGSGTPSGTKLLSGAITDGNDGDGSGITLTNNGTSVINFTGGVILSTGANAAFTATGGGTISATQNNTSIINKITTTTGTALNVSNTTIGASGLTFQSISANGATNGIVLNATGANGLTVTGDGASDPANTTKGNTTAKSGGGTITLGSGGTIQNTTGSGVLLTNANSVSLTSMNITNAGGASVNTGNEGIDVTTVNGLTLDNVKVTGSTGNSGLRGTLSNLTMQHVDIDGNGTAVNTEVNDNWNVRLDNLTGTCAVTNSLFFNSREDIFTITNNGSSTLTLTVTNSEFRDTDVGTSPAVGDATFQMLASGSAVTTLTATGSIFTNARLTGFHYSGNNTSSGTVKVMNSTFGGASTDQNGVDIDIDHQGQGTTLNFEVSGNTTRQGARATSSNSINIFLAGLSTATSLMSGTVKNNIVGNAGVANSGSGLGAGIALDCTGAGTMTATVTGNTVNQVKAFSGNVFDAGTSQTSKLNLKLRSNTFNGNPAQANPQYGIHINAGTGTPGETNQLCIDIGANTVSMPASAIATIDLDSFPGTTTNLFNYSGATNNAAQIQSFFSTNNTLSGPAPLATLAGGTVQGTLAACATFPPLLFAEGGIGTLGPLAFEASLNQQQLDSMVEEAQTRWISSGLTPQQMAAMRGLKFEIAELSNSYLGEAEGNRILVDRHAQGKGWFVDPNPRSDANFAHAVSATRLYTDPFSAPAGHVDLLTAIEHEMGHKLGLPDTYAERDRDNLMYGYLTVGERRLPASGQARNAQPGKQATQHLKLRSIAASSLPPTMVTRRSDKPITPLSGETVSQNIGTLPAGKSVTITFQVQLNASMPLGTSQVTTQGTVTYSGGSPIANPDAGTPVLGPDASVLTDDTGVGTNAPGETDPTVTPIDSPTATASGVSGTILDSNGNPVEGAAIRMSGTQNRLTVTDANGFYHFDDVDTNGFYTVAPTRPNFTFNPSQRSFSQLGQHTDAIFTATSGSSGFVNPLDETVYFVRQQYVDFLGREPDEAGLGFWVNNIESCAGNARCVEGKRIDTSAAFFLSIEFQQTGYLVFKTYQAAFGDMAGAPVPLKLGEFKPDTATIGKDVVVNTTGWQAQLDANTVGYMSDFVQRARFTSAYPTTMTPAEFVDKLFVTASVTPAASDRSAAISEFGAAATTADTAARGRALRRVAENNQLAQQEFNQAFVLIQYFGYLRRDPNTGPNTDYSGYNFWLTKLNGFNGNFGDAEMVKSFLVSGEYRGRFPR
jgi:VCBS repeat-containing protein